MFARYGWSGVTLRRRARETGRRAMLVAGLGSNRQRRDRLGSYQIIGGGARLETASSAMAATVVVSPGTLGRERGATTRAGCLERRRRTVPSAASVESAPTRRLCIFEESRFTVGAYARKG